MRKKRDIIFGITLSIDLIFAACMLILYFIGMPRDIDIAIASTCVALSFIVLVELGYGIYANSKDRKNEEFLNYLKTKDKLQSNDEININSNLCETNCSLPNNENEDVENLKDIDDINKKVDELQAKLDKLLEKKANTTKQNKH